MPDWLGQLPAEYGLAGVFLSAFLSATVLPGNSELVVAGWLYLHPASLWPTLVVATLGNTLGGLTSYALGWKLRALPVLDARERLTPRALNWLTHRGSIMLLLSWVPLIGDALCLAAGWLRLPLTASALWMLLGKGLRYLALALPFLL